MKKYLLNAISRLDKILYRNRDFVVIANNCWGAEIYRELNLEYNTPFVGLFLYGPDYIRLLENLDYYLTLDLSFSDSSRWNESIPDYPIGLLDDIEIHFLHYKDRDEANQKWNRRVSRLRTFSEGYQRFFFKICNRDGVDEQILKRFHALPFPNKVSFSLKEENYPGHFCVSDNENGIFVPDGVKLYHLSYKYFDVMEWVNSGRIRSNFFSRLKSILR